jgi:hypothetical protein
MGTKKHKTKVKKIYLYFLQNAIKKYLNGRASAGGVAIQDFRDGFAAIAIVPRKFCYLPNSPFFNLTAV